MSKESAYQKQQREHGNALKKQQKTGQPAVYGGQMQRLERQVKELKEQNEALLKVVLEHEEKVQAYEQMFIEMLVRIENLETKGEQK